MKHAAGADRMTSPVPGYCSHPLKRLKTYAFIETERNLPSDLQSDRRCLSQMVSKTLSLLLCYHKQGAKTHLITSQNAIILHQFLIYCKEFNWKLHP